MAALAREKFAARADRYDRDASFPAEDFADLFRSGLHGAAVPRSHGGQGLGPNVGLYTLWMMTKELAKVDMALARCWEGHVNSQMLLHAMGNDRQRDRWFQGIVERGDIWAAWSGEPQRASQVRKPDSARRCRWRKGAMSSAGPKSSRPAREVHGGQSSW